MRAAVFHEYGPPEVLRVDQVVQPEPGPGQVLVRVSHAGVNFAEVMFRRGQIPVGLPHVPGLEVAGTVERVGADVADVRPGDRVVALTLAGGGHAELAVADAAHVVVLDGDLAGVPSAVAAAAVCNVTTAWGVVHLGARPQAGDRVLVLAAAGGVGRAVGQLLVGSGARVTGAASTPEKVATLPVEVFGERVTYADLLASGSRFDVVLDSVGGLLRRELASRVELLGRHVVYGDAAHDDSQRALDDIWFSGAAVVGYNLGALAYGRPDVLAAHLRAAIGAVADGTVVVDHELVGLDDVADVHRRLEERRTTGKLVVDLDRQADGSPRLDVARTTERTGTAPWR
jgi:NADPH:quinone reductase